MQADYQRNGKLTEGELSERTIHDKWGLEHTIARPHTLLSGETVGVDAGCLCWGTG